MAARAIAVPLSPPFPAPELQYILDQSGASVLVASPKFAAKANEVLATDLQQKPVYFELPKHTGGGGTAVQEPVTLADENTSGAGMMLYTSGTTNRPKGVLLPEQVLTAQCRSLHQAWQYSPADRLLHVLPLHHIHGTVNAVLTPLFAGSSIEFMFPFNADAVWKRLAAPFLPTTNGTSSSSSSSAATPITFFTVVPTVYSRLLASHKSLAPEVQAAAREATSPAHLRVNISDAAALRPGTSGQDWATGPMYFIQGRKTADIIKTGGEKVSALEVERELLSLPQVAEVAVVAVPSGSWGQKVGAVIILDPDHAARWTPLEMRRALKGRLAAYKIPQVMRVVDHIPRNAMGKINKKQLVKAIFADETSGDEM
ncbi:hypothetical protein PWT90_06920 [Aphanocladium album]|nr:hypothetical protein PWT90_06920 [Aphanocladium album]